MINISVEVKKKFLCWENPPKIMVLKTVRKINKNKNLGIYSKAATGHKLEFQQKKKKKKEIGDYNVCTSESTGSTENKSP